MGNEKSETFEVISLEESTGRAQMQYFNSKGESGIMQSELKDHIFNIKGKGLKFSGTINNKDTEITGKWYLQSSKDWKEFMKLKLEKKQPTHLILNILIIVWDLSKNETDLQ